MGAADVFISYARVDSALAEALANGLQRERYSIWVDRREIRAGETFDTQIEEAIASARVVIVLWSTASEKSRRVRAEASYALRKAKLLPINIDGAEPPLQFLQVQSIDFYGWDHSTDSEQFRRLSRSLSGHIESETRSQTPLPRSASWWRSLLVELTLRFPSNVDEENFQSYYKQRVFPAAQFCMLLGALAYAIFGAVDFYGSNSELAATRFRFLVACPLLILCYALSRTAFGQRHWRALVTSFGLTAFLLVLVTTLQHETLRTGTFTFEHNFGTMNFLLLLSFVPLIQLQTLRSAALGVLAVALHTWFVFRVAVLDFPVRIMDTMFICTTFAVSLCVVYWREQSHRKAFASRRGGIA